MYDLNLNEIINQTILALDKIKDSTSDYKLNNVRRILELSLAATIIVYLDESELEEDGKLN